MPGKSRFTEKEDRQAMHVAASERKKGMPPKKAKSVGYATVNKGKGRMKSGKKPKMSAEMRDKKMLMGAKA